MSAWRYRCPRGHASIVTRQDGYFCQCCEKRYPDEPVDASEVDDFPVADDSGMGSPHRYTVLRELVRICSRSTRNAAKAHNLSTGTQAQRARALAELRDEGLVTVDGACQRTHWYRPTAAGYRWGGDVSEVGSDA